MFWSLALGLGLALGLLWVLTISMAAEAQATEPGLMMAPADDTPLVRETAAGDAAAMQANSGDLPPPQLPEPPYAQQPQDWSAPPAAWRVTGGGVFIGGGESRQQSLLATPPLPGSADLVVSMSSDRAWGVVGVGETVTVTVDGVQMGAALADGNGFFWTTLYDGNGDRPNLSGGETVAIYHDGVLVASTALRAISGAIDVLADDVTGSIAGVTSPIDVTVYPGFGEPTLASYSQTVSTDGSGNFTVDFTGNWDFVGDDNAVVAYEENSIEVHRTLYGQRLVVQPFPLSSIVGFTSPGAAITATVYESDTVTVRERLTGTTDAETGRYEFFPSIETDDIVVVEIEGGSVLSRTVDLLDIYVDAANDRVIGTTTAGAAINGRTNNLTPVGYETVFAAAIADPSGVFTLDFSGAADIMPGRWAGAYIADAEGDDLNLWAPAQGSVEVNQTWNEVSGWAVSPPGPLADGHPLTLTLYSAAEDVITPYNKGCGWYGQYTFSEEEDGLADIGPGDVITVESEGYGWQGVVEVMTMTVAADLDNDRFTGEVETPTDRVELSGQYGNSDLYPLGGSFNTVVTATSPFTAAPSGFDVNYNLSYDVDHRTSGDYLERISRETGGFGVIMPANTVLANFVSPGIPFTITLYDSGGGFKAQLTGTSQEPVGFSGWQSFWSTGEQILTDDRVQVQSAAGFSQTLIVPDLNVLGDPDSDVVTGQGPPNVLLRVGLDDEGQGFVPTDDSGQFTVAVDQLQETWGDGDLQWGENVGVQYFDEHRTWIYDNFQWPQIIAHYNMEGDNEVWGYIDSAFSGNTIIITVTHPVSGDIATGTTGAGACSWCGPEQYGLDFPAGTIVDGNTVAADFGDGYVDSVTVLPVTAEANPDTEVVTITTTPGYYVTFNADGPNGWWDWSWNHDSAEVGPSGVVTFDVSAEYDIVFGTEFNVHIEQEHNHQTHYTFWLPAPELSINKWNTNGYAKPGGVVVYGINYWNDGNGTAENTTIVDTLPASTTWAGDTSGVVPTIGAGGVITWNLGDVEAESSGGFIVTLDVLGSVPTGTAVIGSNCAVITTTSPGDYDPGNNGPSCTGPVDVWDDEVEVAVDKWPYPNNPAPGEEFEYHIDACNNQGAATGPVWLTDTLPLSTTFVAWWSDFGDTTYWTEVVTTGGKVVLTAPGLPGDMCERLKIRLSLDAGATISTNLHNQIAIAAVDDVYTDNDEDLDTDAHVSAPYYDMRVDKGFNNGQLVPGGEIYYSIEYENQGNSAVHAWLTDTLPAGTSFAQAWIWGLGTIAPASVTDDYVVWDLGVVDVNENSHFNIQLNISSTVSSGYVLTNCATVGITETESMPGDNTDCVVKMIYPAGQPNLYVNKEFDGDYQPGYGNIDYRIQLGNAGDQTVTDVHLTDTLPISTNLEWYNIDWWGSSYTDTTSPGELQVVFERIEPGWSGQIYLSARLDEPNAPMRWYTNTVEVDTPPDDAEPADNSYQLVAFSGGEVRWVDLDVGDNNIWGCAYSGPVTITTASEERVYGGDCWDDSFNDPFQPGHAVTVAAGAAVQPVRITIPTPFSATADSTTDLVWGQIDALDHEWVTVDPDYLPDQDVQTDGGGNYSAGFSDIPRGGRGQVRYNTQVNYADVTFHRRFQARDLLITVDYEHDWVNGNYEPGHTVWLTLTESASATIKATSEITTGPIPDWGGQSGFQASGEDWVPQNPDIIPGDWVFGLLRSAVHTTTVRVGAIDGEVDVGADTVSGTLHAAWLAPDLVTVRCEIHEENGENIEVPNVDPDGGSFFCDFGGGLYDIVPGTNVAVNYAEPDGDRVQTHPANPAPRVRVEKWSEGIPGQGGNLAFRLRYMNEGSLAAPSVVISETLQGMSYITDTSGLAHSGSGIPGDPIVWQLGTLNPQQDWAEFTVFVTVTEVAGNRITNTAQIATSSPFDQGDPGEKESWWWEEVRDNGTQLWINKDVLTHDPIPDSDFVYVLDACNGGEDNTDSTWATVTDTLPLSTTLVDWWADAAGWSAVMEQDHLLVLRRPTIDAHHCTPIYLRVHLTDTVSAGDELCNQAEIFTANDTGDLGDNETTWCHNVGEPHTNLGVDKWWAGGQLVPGGQIYYHGDYYNDGNLPVADVSITETLPVSTTLLEWRHYDRNWNDMGLVSPTLVAPNQYVWDVGALPNGAGGYYQIELQIDGAADPGTVLTNTIEISPQPDEDSYDDNVATLVETVFDHGPNLRVHKSGYWHDWGPDTRQIEYNVNVENVGDETVDWVTITDTYPSEMYMNSGVNMDFWAWWDWGPIAGSNAFTVALETLEPGWSTGFNFTVITDTSPIPSGLILTNTVELAPGDPYPDDNVDRVVHTTGPDLFVEKELVAGDFLPGELITFSLTFGNDVENWQWWWNLQGNAWLTDTLPTGMEYVTSTLHWCGPGGDWCAMPPMSIDGDEYTWELWPLDSGSWNEVYLTVRITDTATGLDTLTNQVEIASDQPISDTEAYYSNNSDAYDVPIALPYFELDKVYQSSRVAGTAVTYTLTVTNVGNERGTGVVLSDTLPGNLTYGSSDGTLSGGDVTWSLGTIAAGGGTAGGWFNGTLPCTAGMLVNNDTYLVIESTEGVESDPGAAVGLVTIAPTLNPAFSQSRAVAEIGETIYFTDTSTYNGTDVVAWAWDFGDGESATGGTASHAYTGSDAYTVTLTITDACGFSDIITVPSAVTIADEYIYLPLVMRNS